jgi:hypothetical protein
VAKSLEEARKKLDDEYGQVRRHFDTIHHALNKLEEAGPEEHLENLLEELEEAVKKVRTGGLVGHGANGHTRARKEFLELKDGQ